MKMLRAAWIAALFLLATAISAFAGDVTLISRDGSIKITGTLLGFDGEFYRVDTEFGVLTVDGSGVNCDGPGCPTLGAYVAEFSISGPPEMGDVLLPALIEGFALNSGYALTREQIVGNGVRYRLFDKKVDREVARISIHLTSTAEGFADLLGEEADMVLALREATANERELAREAGLGDLRSIRQYRVIARDALVPVVSPGNPVRRIRMQDLARIYSSKVQSWAELGGENAPITPHLTDPESGIGALFVSRVLERQGEQLSSRVALHGTITGLNESITHDPFGIGISTLSHSRQSDIVTLSGDCAFEVVPSGPSVKSGDYPLTVPMYLYLPGRRLPKLARDFLAYLRSDRAQFVIRRAGFVDQALTTVPIAEQGRRFANAITAAGNGTDLAELQRMVALMTGKERLTLTLRFRAGSAKLDTPSLASAGLLAAALESGNFDGKTLVFAGFSDGIGDASVNRRLSARRAAAAKAAVLAETEAFDPSRVTIETYGFGEALPMACDDSNWGRQVNRRVEIWVD